MSLPFGILGLLTYRESTGYELAKVFNDSLNNFWHAQASQIYRELDRLEQKKLVESHTVIQDKRPNKRVYTITESGRKALHDWLNVYAAEFQNVHEPLLMRVFFGEESPDITLALLKGCRDMCLAYIENFSKDIKVIDRYAAETTGGEKKRRYWDMTLDYGISHAHMTAEWAQRCIDKIEGGEL